MPSLFDRLQSLLVEVDGWSSDEACNTESEDEVEMFSGVEEISTKVITGRAVKRNGDTSSFKYGMCV
jgi:hypothetical protein